MGKCVDSSHEGNGTPGHGIVFPAVEKLLSAVGALIDLDVGGAGPSGRALALVTRRQGELIDASAKCDAKVADLRRQLSQRDARIAELEAKLAAAARLANDSAEAAGEMVGSKPTANDRAVERIKEWCATIPEPGRPPELCAAESYVCGAIMSIINEEAGRG